MSSEAQKLESVKRSLAISQKVVSAAILDAKKRKKSCGKKKCRRGHCSASASLTGGKRRRRSCKKGSKK